MSEAATIRPAGNARAVQRWWSCGLLAIIVAVAAYLRLNNLGGDALWRDEATSWAQARGNVFQIIAATVQDNYPPLHNLLLAATMRALGDSEWALRLPSSVLGVLNVAALYWLGRLAATRAAALIAAALLALSPFAIFHSQEVRMYALLALAATLLGGCGLWLTQRPAWPRALLASLAGAALLYSHPYGLPTWLCLVAAVALTVSGDDARSRIAVWVASQAIAAMAFLPWIWVLLTRARAVEQSSFWVPFPTPAYVFGEILQLTSGPWVLAFLLVSAAIAVIASLRRTRVIAPPSPRTVLALLLWCVGSIVIGVAASAIGTPVFVARYVIGSLPPLLLLAAIGIAGLIRGPATFVAALAVAVGVASIGLATAMPQRPEDWRSAIAYLRANLRPADCLLVPDDLAANVIAYYFRPLPACFDDAASAGFQPSQITGPRVLAIVVGSKGGTVATLPPLWKETGSVPFRGIRVATFARE